MQGNGYQYQLDKSSLKFECPRCHKKRFVRYIDTHYGGAYLPAEYGKCDRLDNCNYHLNPYKSKYNKGYLQNKPQNYSHSSPYRERKQEENTKTSFSDVYKESLSTDHYLKNDLVQFLGKIAGDELTEKATQDYFIGTFLHWNYSTLFWQIDINNHIRAGKIMKYEIVQDKDTPIGLNLKRVKSPKSLVTWVHSLMKLENYNLQQCFFGEHLLKQFPDINRVLIFESEKTAVIASMYLPNYICLASGGKNGIKWNEYDFSILLGRTVTLYPDLKAFEDWKKKAGILRKAGIAVSISGLLENNATQQEKEAGLDLADYLLRFPLPKPSTLDNGVNLSEAPQQIFYSTELPNHRICLSPGITIADAAKFVDEIVKGNVSFPLTFPGLESIVF